MPVSAPAPLLGCGSSAPRSSYSHLASTDVALPLCAERSKIIASRIQFSRQWAWIYAGAIVLNGVLLAWAVLEATTSVGRSLDSRTKRAIFVSADLTVTLFVLTEIFLNWTTQGRRVFCVQWTNHIDICVAGLCLAALGMAVGGPVAELEEEEEAEAVVMLLRYSAQLLRLAMLVRNFRRQAQKKDLEVHLDLNLDAVFSDRDSSFDDGALSAPARATSAQSQPRVAIPGQQAQRHQRLAGNGDSQEGPSRSQPPAAKPSWWSRKPAGQTLPVHANLVRDRRPASPTSTDVSLGGMFLPVATDPPLCQAGDSVDSAQSSPHHRHPPAEAEQGDQYV